MDMERLKAVAEAMEGETPFHHACNMEDPLGSIHQLSTALCMIAETLDDHHGLVVLELAEMIGTKVRELGEEHEYFFGLHHPDSKPQCA